jgi:hypothetical protein
MERIGTVNGLLTQKGILKKNSTDWNCGAITIAHIKESDTVLWYDGKKTSNITPLNLIKVDNLNDRGKAINLPHYKEIVSENEIIKIIHWDNSKRNKDDEEKGMANKIEMLSPKVEIINQIDIDIDECIEKYNKEQ